VQFAVVKKAKVVFVLDALVPAVASMGVVGVGD